MSGPGEKTEEKPAEASSSSDNKETERNSLISILTFLSELRDKRRDVHVALEKLDAIGYGPKPWCFTIKDSFSGRYKVVQATNRSQAQIVRDPFISGTFRTFDELHLHAQKAISFIVDQAFTIYSEPKTVAINGVLANDAEALSIPLTEMCASELPGENVCAVVQPYCLARRANNINYSDGFIAEGLRFAEIRKLAAEISREEMRPLRTLVIRHEATFNNGMPDAKPYLVLHPNDLVNVIANPFNLNAIFDHLPLPVQYSAELVLEACYFYISFTNDD